MRYNECVTECKRSGMTNVESRLNKSEVRRWLEGQREAEKLIRKERIRSLLSRSTEESLAIYLSLKDNPLGRPIDVTEPSCLLVAMRRALDRLSRRERPAP